MINTTTDVSVYNSAIMTIQFCVEVCKGAGKQMVFVKVNYHCDSEIRILQAKWIKIEIPISTAKLLEIEIEIGCKTQWNWKCDFLDNKKSNLDQNRIGMCNVPTP